MPSKFDPVRDAVLNSPVARTAGLPHTLPAPVPPALDQPAPDSTAVSPVARRAPSLSLLLNDDNDSASLFTPASARAPPAASIAHGDESDDRLGHLPPLRRRSLGQPDEAADSYFARPSSSRAMQSPRPKPSRDSVSVFREPDHVPHPPSTSAPATSHYSPSPRQAMKTSKARPNSPVASATLPYRPRHRITPAASVLIPLTPQEADVYQRQQGLRLLGKRKRVDSANDEPATKRSRDVAHVVDHYNARPDVGVDVRQESPIIGLKNFNNWIKSVIITRFAHPSLLSSPLKGIRGMRGKVLDMGCGKGGDLNKWNKAKAKEYVGVDIAVVSVDQARGRWEGLRGSKVEADFAALDCYTELLSTALSPDQLAEPFDVVSMQFCMHYAFENVNKARVMLENVSRWLRPGGIFIGTIPNAEQLFERLDSIPAGAGDYVWGNSVYQIRFENGTQKPMFGHRYWFYLKDAVEDVPEYVVQWDNFEKMCLEYGMQLLYKKEFHEIFEEHREHREYGPLLQRMKVVSPEGESQMDEDQWEAANVYVGFAFQKR